MSLMIMKSTISTSIRGGIPDSEENEEFTASEYLQAVEDQFKGSSKALASTLMMKMITMKYNGSSGVREHIMRMNDMASQLKKMNMEISEGFLVHFMMTSLPAQFTLFKINYNTQKEKWEMSELIAMCVQEEERLKTEQPESAHYTTEGTSKGHFKKKTKGKGFGKGKKKVASGSAQGLTGGMKSRIRCHFCKKLGHIKKECSKYEEWLHKKGISRETETQERGANH
ncbi:uncharacterized protein LOC143848666 [Tasmannia lanceolata]|uniref:uncharacterized protein LOC143848666 n=1 Tax=Tasmannia lanceolata TaxID=3420 RepID=UPI004062A0A7